MKVYYVTVRTTEKNHTVQEHHYGRKSGPFTSRNIAEQAAANALKQQDIMSATITVDEQAEEDDEQC